MKEKYYPFITKGDQEGELLPGIFWYDEEYSEWIVEVGGINSHYQVTQSKCPTDNIETSECYTKYTEAWIHAELKVNNAYDKIIKSWKE